MSAVHQLTKLWLNSLMLLFSALWYLCTGLQVLCCSIFKAAEKAACPAVRLLPNTTSTLNLLHFFSFFTQHRLFHFSKKGRRGHECLLCSFPSKRLQGLPYACRPSPDQSQTQNSHWIRSLFEGVAQRFVSKFQIIPKARKERRMSALLSVPHNHKELVHGCFLRSHIHKTTVDALAPLRNGCDHCPR